MKKWFLPLQVLLLLTPTLAKANQITPAFTQGSMNATTNTTQTVTETINQKVYGGELKSWSGTNITATGNDGVTGSDTVFTLTTPGEDFQLETVTRTADTNGLVLMENIDINRTINTTATTQSLSVFSQ